MPEPLAADFPPVSTEEWLRAATAKRGVAPEDAPPPPTEVPAGATEDGLPLRWLYTPADALASDPGGVPGQAPFVRGVGPAGEDDPAWQIRQAQTAAGRDQARAAILEDLEGGATQIALRLDRAARAGHAPGGADFAATRGRDGVAISTADDLAATLDGVHLDLAPVALEAGAQGLPAAALLLAVLARGDQPASASLRIDPLGALAAEGDLGEDPAAAVARAGRIAAEVDAHHPAATALAVDTRAHANAGATAARELAIAIATAVAYLRAAEAAGLDPARTAGQIEFTLAVGPRQFEEIAKLRALRRLWARVLELSGVAAEQRRSAVFARTSDRMLAGVDPWTNMLRATTAGFAAAVGGADGLTVAPFDTVVADAVGADGPGPLGRRIARNTQLILQEESGLRRVADPAGGSWYVEALTDALATAAWERLQAIEAAGGALAVLTDGSWAAELATAADEREQALRERRRDLTGVNQFPLLGDDKVHPQPADVTTLAARETARLAERPALDGAIEARVREAAASGDGLLAALVAAAEAGARIDELAAWIGSGPAPADASGLPVRRDAEPFEALRREAAAHVAGDGDGAAPLDQTVVSPAGPSVFLACLGPLAAHTAAATWATNFFGVGGLAARQSRPLTSSEAVEQAWREAGGLPVAVVTFGRDESDAGLRDTVATLRRLGATTILLAQAPDARAAEVGADGAVRDGVDMVTVLRAALDTVVGAERTTTNDAEAAR
ncbi:methylmalonyl-CoA mutase family protein [Patulibacter defluvii]|uniref:methylmalonyl-CoA mutase family protein n=1 Tax=Patulibacter defluvii TaxID=3095358 RepID=UPI002A74B29D|nr:methylmalonyl-CoA mutase family protein [Patulibacter sp. DM4]